MDQREVLDICAWWKRIEVLKTELFDLLPVYKQMADIHFHSLFYIAMHGTI